MLTLYSDFYMFALRLRQPHVQQDKRPEQEVFKTRGTQSREKRE